MVLTCAVLRIQLHSSSRLVNFPPRRAPPPPPWVNILLHTLIFGARIDDHILIKKWSHNLGTCGLAKNCDDKYEDNIQKFMIKNKLSILRPVGWQRTVRGFPSHCCQDSSTFLPWETKINCTLTGEEKIRGKSWKREKKQLREERVQRRFAKINCTLTVVGKKEQKLGEKEKNTLGEKEKKHLRGERKKSTRRERKKPPKRGEREKALERTEGKNSLEERGERGKNLRGERVRRRSAGTLVSRRPLL